MDYMAHLSRRVESDAWVADGMVLNQRVPKLIDSFREQNHGNTWPKRLY